MRNHRYKVSFGYVAGVDPSKSVMFGKLDEKVYNFEDVSYLIKMLDPLRSISILSAIENLRKNIIFTHTLDDCISYDNVGNVRMKRIVKIVRN